MDCFSGIKVGRLDSLSGVGQSVGTKGPSLASFLCQRANQVLGSRHVAAAVETQPSVGAPPQDSTPQDPVLARQMEQMQRLHSSISLPSNYQGISVVV